MNRTNKVFEDGGPADKVMRVAFFVTSGLLASCGEWTQAVSLLTVAALYHRVIGLSKKIKEGARG